MVEKRKALPQCFLRFNMSRISDDAVINWADFLAGGRVVMAYALGAQGGIDYIDLCTKADGLIGALRLAHIAIGAFFCD